MTVHRRRRSNPDVTPIVTLVSIAAMCALDPVVALGFVVGVDVGCVRYEENAAAYGPERRGDSWRP